MIVNMSEKATEQEIAHVIERIREAGYQPHVTRGVRAHDCSSGGKWAPSWRSKPYSWRLVWINVVAIAQPFFKLVKAGR